MATDVNINNVRIYKERERGREREFIRAIRKTLNNRVSYKEGT